MTKTNTILSTLGLMLIMLIGIALMPLTAHADSSAVALDEHMYITGGEQGVDWTYSDKDLTILKSGSYKIECIATEADMENDDPLCDIQINIGVRGEDNDINVTLTLKNVDIEPEYAGMNLFGSPKVTLMLEGDNYITAGNYYNAGIQTNNPTEDTYLIIDSESDGFLYTLPGYYIDDDGEYHYANVGIGDNTGSGNITIKGGYIVTTAIGSRESDTYNKFTLDGNALLVMWQDSITDTSDKDSWNGLLGNTTDITVYGTTTLPTNLDLEDREMTITIPEGTSLTIPEGITLSGDKSKIVNKGTLIVEGTQNVPVDDSSTGESSYKITAANGSASAEYAKEGEVITLTASNLPAGKQVKTWLVNGEAITGNTFTMPATPVTVTYQLEAIPSDKDGKDDSTKKDDSSASASRDSSADTGDAFDFMPLVVIMLLSICATGVVGVRKK